MKKLKLILIAAAISLFVSDTLAS